ncbi:MAG: hypothetical protein INR71_01945 [Terriglobus roseus]|nr:hypothetical protein [Terriglobus roseus]
MSRNRLNSSSTAICVTREVGMTLVQPRGSSFADMYTPKSVPSALISLPSAWVKLVAQLTRARHTGIGRPTSR